MENEFDAFLQAGDAQTNAQPVNEFDAFLESADAQPAININNAAKGNPAARAKVLDIQSQTNIPVDVVERNAPAI